MINSKLLRQHQLAECAPARTAGVGVNAGSRHLSRSSENTEECKAQEVESPTQDRAGKRISNFAILWQVFCMRRHASSHLFAPDLFPGFARQLLTRSAAFFRQCIDGADPCQQFKGDCCDE